MADKRAATLSLSHESGQVHGCPPLTVRAEGVQAVPVFQQGGEGVEGNHRDRIPRWFDVTGVTRLGGVPARRCGKYLAHIGPGGCSVTQERQKGGRPCFGP